MRKRRRAKSKSSWYHKVLAVNNFFRVACMHVRCVPDAKYTLLFSHGNAVDLGQMSSFFIGLGNFSAFLLSFFKTFLRYAAQSEYHVVRLLRLRSKQWQAERVKLEQGVFCLLREAQGALQSTLGTNHSIWPVNWHRFVKNIGKLFIYFFLKYRQPIWRQKSTVPLSSSTRPSRAACAFSSPIQSARGFSTLSKSKKLIFLFFSKLSILQHWKNSQGEEPDPGDPWHGRWRHSLYSRSTNTRTRAQTARAAVVGTYVLFFIFLK